MTHAFKQYQPGLFDMAVKNLGFLGFFKKPRFFRFF